jgi:hypothetical protein
VRNGKQGGNPDYIQPIAFLSLSRNSSDKNNIFIFIYPAKNVPPPSDSICGNGLVILQKQAGRENPEVDCG